jgi:hypothetical protein
MLYRDVVDKKLAYQHGLKYETTLASTKISYYYKMTWLPETGEVEGLSRGSPCQLSRRCELRRRCGVLALSSVLLSVFGSH